MGRRPGSQFGAHERQPIDVSLKHQCFTTSPSPSLPLSLIKKKKKDIQETHFVVT